MLAGLVQGRGPCYIAFMGWLVPLVFIGVPALEIALLIKVGGSIGAGWTFVVVVATGIAGAGLAKRQGLRALNEVQQAMASGQSVGTTVVSAVILLVAGVLLITPGFVTVGLGFALLVPLLRNALARHLATRFGQHVQVYPGDSGNVGPPPPGVIDV